MKKNLPLHLDMGISHDCWHVYRLAAIMADNRFKPWLMERFIELEMGISIGSPIDQFWIQYYRLEYFDLRMFYDGLLDTSYKLPRRDEFRACTIDAIDSGQYVLLACDQYYMETTLFFQKEHVIHEVLLCGYDNLRRIWQVLVLQNDLWSIRDIPYEQIELAFDSAILRIEDHPAAHRWICRFEMPYTLIRPKPAPDKPIRLYKIYESIENSLAGAERHIKERTLSNEELHCSEWTGISIYRGLREISQTILAKHPALLTEKHILLGMKKLVENKQGFLTRLRYLHSLHLIEASDILLDKAFKVAELVNEAYFWLAKYQASWMTQHLGRLNDILQRAEELDVPLLEEALQTVGTALDGQYEEQRRHHYEGI